MSVLFQQVIVKQDSLDQKKGLKKGQTSTESDDKSKVNVESQTESKKTGEWLEMPPKLQ